MTANSKYAFFRGCLIPTRYPHLEYLARIILPQIGISLADIEEFTCCADPIQFRSADQLTWLAIAARNLCLAEEQGLGIICLCNGCFNTLAMANDLLKKEPGLREKVNRILAATNHQFKGSIEVKHFLKAIGEDVGVEKLKSYVEVPLHGLNVATHTGCHLLSPENILGFDDAIDPTVFDSLVAALGANPVDYELKTLCCGVAFALSGQRAAASHLVKDKLVNMREFGADCIAVACPFCFQQFDLGQLSASREYNLDFKLPVLYYLQLLALAMGSPLEEIEYGIHKVKDEDLESKLDKIQRM